MRCLFDLADKKAKKLNLEKETLKDDFWNDVEEAQKTISAMQDLKNIIEPFESLKNSLEDMDTMIDMAEEEGEGSSFFKETIKEIERIEKDYETLHLATLLSGEYDANAAILSIHAGAGGTEAQDWANMLYRMYSRFVEQFGFSMEELDYNQDGEAGIKSVTFLVKGKNAYGYLKGEKGVHRLVRISPFDAAKRRHTSFASVDVTPELDDDISIIINPEDLRIDTYRSSGKGGQHVNKTDSAVRITHLPTGVVVQCQNERSQHMNKDRAMKMLYGKLVQIQEEEKKERIEDIQGKYSQIAWGSQIRSYVFHPYTLVKDHRTNAEVGNVTKVMDGDLEFFINEYLKLKASEKND